MCIWVLKGTVTTHEWIYDGFTLDQNGYYIYVIREKSSFNFLLKGSSPFCNILLNVSPGSSGFQVGCNYGGASDPGVSHL